MLNIQIICIGKIKEDYLRSAVNEYSKRLSRFCKLEILELPDEKIPDKLNTSLANEIKQNGMSKKLANTLSTAQSRTSCDSRSFLMASSKYPSSVTVLQAISKRTPINTAHVNDIHRLILRKFDAGEYVSQ